ncbi:unnamed protein product [Phytophthora fragariaefolia]|uniref:Unnamed protein product n=1 Tax=Phytophthora fragariaefolia TaxID=1490495 RepID=A0A9W6YCZ9_9STRA|nr:unnamed protein product [Phytophthora fragariaefolia]
MPPELEVIRSQLDAVGFPKIQDWKRFQWEQVSLSALKAYKEIEGDLLVPRKFVVPEGAPKWPKSAWGLKLGSHVNFLRMNKEKLVDYQIRDLDEIGFVWVVADYNWDVMFMPALRQYQRLYGHCDVPQNFVVGESEDEKNKKGKWPERLAGYRLGAMVNRIRAISAFSEYVERDQKELEVLGFYLNSNDQKWQETILPAFETYHRLYGDCNIAALFIVPEEDPWPKSTWGNRLGFIAQNIRNRGDFFRQVARDFERLEQIGFVWNASAAKWEYGVMPALATYVLAFGNADIPANFVVPSEDPWPEASHGLKLGELAANPDRRRRFDDFIEIDRMQLEALGFFWSAVPVDDISEISEDDDYELL